MATKNNPAFRRIAALLLILSAANVWPAPLFDDNSVLDVTLTGSLGTVFDHLANPLEHPFTLRANDVDHHIGVRIRGNSRLKVCTFPPLRLNFRKADTAQSVFAGQDKLKLVTHCRNHDRGEQNMLEEFAAYRIFNILTDVSYRVRLLRIHYRDAEGSLTPNPITRFGFVLETAKQLADRIGAERARLPGFPVHRHDRDQAALIYVYQYLIGNTDWGFVTADNDDTCCHNGDLFERDSVVLAVPYDFDLAGLVNAPYAFPAPELRMKRVTQRRYRGLCTDRDVLQRAVRQINSQKDDILKLVIGIPGLSDKNVVKAERYLKAFFKKAANEAKLIRTLESRCLD